MGRFIIKKKYSISSKTLKDMDIGLVVAILALCFMGIINIYICTKGNVFSNPFIFVKRQLVWFILSLIVSYFILVKDYSVAYTYAPIIYWGSIILLIAVWIPGIGAKVNGARGWLNLRVCMLQPAEIAKFAIILMLAKLIDDMESKINSVKNLCKIGLYVMLPVFLILIQKDMGMTMVCFFIVLGILFIAGLDKRIIYGGFISLLVLIVILWNSGLILPHQKERILSFVSDSTDEAGEGYQLTQGLIGVGNGGVFGIDLSLDPDDDPGYAGTHVPEIQTDFIFTAIAEQWGFCGVILLLFLYGVMIVKMINIARNSRDIFGNIVTIGMVSYLLFAVFQNIGMTIKLLPITGITLPLISYGGSSLLTTLMALALVVNIGMRREKIHF